MVRNLVSREDLERAITAAVKAQCEGFVGVLIKRIRPEKRSGANWMTRGIKFGTADRDKSNKVLSTVVEQMQREFDLSDTTRMIQPGKF